MFRNRVLGMGASAERDRPDPFFSVVVTIGDRHILQRLLQNPNINAYQTDRSGLTALMIAAGKGYADCIKCFVDASKTANINKQDTYGITALMLASSKGHYECVKHLLDAELIDVNLCSRDRRTAIMIAAERGCYEIVKTLLGVEGIAVNISDSQFGRTALMLATLGGHKECAKCLIDTGLTDVNLRDDDGNTALMIAAEEGHYGILKILTGVEGIAVNISDNFYGRTALTLATERGGVKCVKCLIDTELTNVNLCDRNGNTALMTVAEKGYNEIVEILSGVEGIDVNISDNRSRKTALMLASQNGHKEIVRCLIDTRLTDVNVCDVNGNTALMIAAQTGYYEIIDTLTGVEEIAVNVCDKMFGRTALMLAANEGNSHCVECLLERKDIDVNFQNKDKSTALTLASKHGHLECVKILLSCSITEVNARDHRGQTALLCASSKGHTHCVDALLSCKAEVNLHDNKGQTALMLAVLSRQLECVKRIIGDTNVKVWERDNQGMTAFKLATEIPDIRYLRCFFDITTTQLDEGGEELDQNNQIFTTMFSQNNEAYIRYLTGFTWRKPYIYERDHNEESVVNLIIRNGLGRCLTCFLLAYSDVPLTENCPCSHSLLDNTEACEYDEDLQTGLMIASKRGNSECLEYLLQFQRIRFHLLVMLMQKEFLVFGTISIVFYKRLCSLVRDHNNIDQFLYMMCNGDEIGKCVDYLLSAVICQMNSSGNSALSYAFSVWSTSRLQLKLLLQHLSGKNHLLVHMETFCLKNPMTKLDLSTVLEFIKAGFFLWKWYPEFHGYEDSINILTRELVVRDFAPGLFECQGKHSSPLYYAFMSGNHGLVRYLMANLYLTPCDLECFQGDTQERECLLQIESEDIQQIYQEHLRVPWSLERLSLLSLSNWLRKNKEQKDVDKVLDKLPEMFRSRLPFRNHMRMICQDQWEEINLDFLNQRMSSSLSDENLFHGQCCDGGYLHFERLENYLDVSDDEWEEFYFDSDMDQDYHYRNSNDYVDFDFPYSY